MKTGRILLVLLILGMASGSVLATQLVLQNGLSGYTGCEDTTLRASHKEYDFGGADAIRIQGEGLGSYAMALIKFDTSGIPAGQTIENATLRLYFKHAYLTGWQRFKVYPMLVGANFGTRDGDPAPAGIVDYHQRAQAQADWGAPINQDKGPQPGDPVGTNADFDYTQGFASQNHDVNTSGFGWDAGYGWVETNVTALAQQWYAGTLDDSHGMFLVGDQSQQAALYWSSDYAGDISLRPQLVIDYVPEPMTMSLLVLGGAALLRRRRA